MEITFDQFTQKMQLLFFGEKEELLQRVGELTKDALHEWYESLPPNWFDSPEQTFPDGTPRHEGRRTFMLPLSQSWRVETAENGFNLIFDEQRKTAGKSSQAWGLRLQQYGKLIKPVEKKALTIPVTAAARNRSAKEFSRETGKKLFVVKKKDAKDPSHIGSLVWEDPGGDLNAAYVLRKSANVRPLKERRGHDALPSKEQINAWARDAYVEYLQYKLYYARRRSKVEYNG